MTPTGNSSNIKKLHEPCFSYMEMRLSSSYSYVRLSKSIQYEAKVCADVSNRDIWHVSHILLRYCALK